MSRPQTNFYVTGGTLRGNASCYVPRQADVDLYEGLKRREFCYVLTSRQMGKSSLMLCTAQKLRGEGIHVAVLDPTAIGQNLNAEQWYDGMIGHLGRQLRLEDELDDSVRRIAGRWAENPGLLKPDQGKARPSTINNATEPGRAH